MRRLASNMDLQRAVFHLETSILLEMVNLQLKGVNKCAW